MKKIPANSLALQVIFKMSIGAIMVVLLITSLGYWYVYDKAEHEAIDKLKAFVLTRTQQESVVFRLAEDNLNDFKKEYLTLYKLAPKFSDEDFATLFFRDEKGATRMKKEYFSGVVTPNGVYHSGMSGFIGNNVKIIDSDLKRRLILAYRLISEMGPRYVTRFSKFYLHASFPENAIVIYWPEAPWGLNAKADLIMTAGAVVKGTLQEYNPERHAVWTDLYYDLTANKWTITYELPVDYEGKHLLTPSHDIQLNDLVDRLIMEHLEGSYNFIVSKDGKLVAHPQKLDEIKKEMGVINLDKLGDPTLNSMFAQIQNSGEVTDEVRIIDDHVNGTYLAVAKMSGPEWWYVTVYPKTLIQKNAHSTASIIIILGVMFFCCMMLIVLYVIRKSVETPINLLKIAAEKLSEGDYSFVIDGKLKVPTSVPNEIGLLVKAFCQMAIQINDSNKILEEKIEERTQALATANKQLTRLSFFDSLTGIHNRRAFDQDIQVKFQEAQDGGENFALMICDIDFFKLYNDHYGHEGGDQALKETADTMVASIGRRGHVYRYGGEEFAIIINYDSEQSYEKIASTLLKDIEQRNWPHCVSPYGVLTVSAGLVLYQQTFKDIKEMFVAADQNLYISKKAGRNQFTY